MSASSTPDTNDHHAILVNLLSLIDDPDETVHTAVMDKLRSMCPAIIPELRLELERVVGTKARAFVLDLIHEYQQQPLDDLVRLLKLHLHTSQDIDLEEAMVLLDGFGHPAANAHSMSKYLDELALRVHEVFITKTPANDLTHVMALQTVLFEQEGFHGASEDYYAPSNSYLTSVIERKEGIPVSLAAIELLVADRIGLDIQGVAMPFHFLLFVPELGLYLDPFQYGTFISRDDCVTFVRRSGLSFDQRMLDPVRNVDIIIRMLRNLALAHERHAEVWEAQAIHKALRDLGPHTPHH